MADGVLGLGAGGAASLNQETIDKLKAAERKATVEPLEKRLEEITKEGGEQEKVAEIKKKIEELLESIKLFDLYAKDGVTAFEQKSASATGTAALFDAANVGKLNVGTTSVKIEALAQRDVLQSAKIYDKTSTILGADSDDDTLVITHGGNDFTFETKDKTYEQLITEINYNSNFSANLEEVSSGEYRLVIKSKEPGLDNALTIKENGSLSLGLETNNRFESSKTHSSSDTPSAGNLVLNGETFTLDGSESYADLATKINASGSFTATYENDKLQVTRTDGAEVTVTNDNFDLGLEKSGISSKVYAASNSFTSTDTPSAGNIQINGTTFALDGSESYADLATKINADANLNADFVNGKLVVSTVDGSDITVNNDDFGFGLESSTGSQTVKAANMEATVDGVAYNVSSNSITVDGGLKITAVELGDASINVQEDTSTLANLLKGFTDKYNELVLLVDTELYSAEGVVEDKSSLRSIMDGVKGKLFGSYGKDSDLNVFNFGFEIDKSGVLSLDTEKLNDALQKNPEDLKMLFLGVAESEGLGTQLKTYLDDLDSFQGLITRYEEGLDTRKKSIEEEQKKAEEQLDSKYALMSQQFASYGVLISSFESQFAGLKLMINQSTASN